MTFDKGKNALKVTNISRVLESERLRIDTPFVYVPSGESYYLHEGKEIEQKEFENKYPLEQLQKMAYKGENSDKSKN